MRITGEQAPLWSTLLSVADEVSGGAPAMSGSLLMKQEGCESTPIARTRLHPEYVLACFHTCTHPHLILSAASMHTKWTQYFQSNFLLESRSRLT